MLDSSVRGVAYDELREAVQAVLDHCPCFPTERDPQPSLDCPRHGDPEAPSHVVLGVIGGYLSENKMLLSGEGLVRVDGSPQGLSTFLCDEAWAGRWTPLQETNIKPLADQTALVLAAASFVRLVTVPGDGET